MCGRGVMSSSSSSSCTTTSSSSSHLKAVTGELHHLPACLGVQHSLYPSDMQILYCASSGTTSQSGGHVYTGNTCRLPRQCTFHSNNVFQQATQMQAMRDILGVAIMKELMTTPSETRRKVVVDVVCLFVCLEHINETQIDR